MAECLILGLAGVGKTSVVQELVNRGRLAYDADNKQAVPGLGSWFDADGIAHTYSSNPTWRASHHFRWDMAVLGRFLKEHTDQMVYLAGLATNIDEAVPLFGKVVLLDAGVDTLCQRLGQPTRQTPYPFDCTDEYRACITEALPGFRSKLLDLGATAINAELELTLVVDSLIACVEG